VSEKNPTGAAPPLSLGVPVFNEEPFLRQALDSILAQTYGDFEIVISDNASTDRTPEIIREYAARDRRIRCFRQSANIGSGNNWTFVAKKARGQWFKWISANDDFAPRLLEDCMGPLKADREVVLCYGRTQLIDLAGTKLQIYGGDFDALSPDPIERYRTVRERLHLGTPVQAGIIRLDALSRCGYMGNIRDGDRVLIAGLALIGRFVLLPQVLFYRRWDRSVASALRNPLDVQRLYKPNARRPPLFLNLPRQVGMIEVAIRAPTGFSAKCRALAATVRYTNWRRKFSAQANDLRAGGRPSP
jgi:glycosyltransferase involved in cell wall biosynthesis